MTRPHALLARVIEVIRETPDAHSLVLEPDEPERFAYRPGQFVTVHVPTDRPEGAARCYSLCGSPHLGEPLKITVKRTAGGYASNWICDNVTAGTELEVLRPSGTFTPHSLDGDFALFAAGSGITPVMSILKSVLHAASGNVVLIYANRDENSVIFRGELRELVHRVPGRLAVVHWLESLQGLPTVETLTALARPYAGRASFICGPDPFMDSVTAALAAIGTPHDRVHVERFLSLSNDPFAVQELAVGEGGPAVTVEVHLDGDATTLSWPVDSKLLDVLLKEGLDAPYSCREGACSACACRLLEGQVKLEHNEVLEQEDLDDGYILACQARPVTDRVVVSYDD